MITSIHTLIYSDDAQATRTFLRGVLGWKYVAEDWDKDWLIFKSGPSEMGVHPTHSVYEGKTYDHPRQHSIAMTSTRRWRNCARKARSSVAQSRNSSTVA
jgi:catechol 2,3-dioxygenase-like lactoylglutathione lyase family enzyme